ncbi:pectate lyase [Novosphingobium hassiacum]|uniref:Pectate lyase n=1 Tax=Novosphingobium hassiacum TaxID=173676 RepID=A0A7W6EY75_9SPHN|nr:pectate lyase [Novosphingobium hassiacum]MBB3862564.1 pectate lyase [Novosphingobium hassiacum]
MQRQYSSVCALALLAMIATTACSSSTEGKNSGSGSSSGPSERKVLAFPGAVGFGAYSRGGTGGRIMPVETLADGGPGSLRSCIEASGPRVCVFRVSGTIRFTKRPPWITNPYLTIAGQTAPGSGITLAHSGGEVGRTPLVIKGTHDVVIRNIRVRNDRLGDERGSEDSITIENSTYVIIDHVSASWARDELINGFADNDFITISNSIFAYGLPRHDKCALLGSDPPDAQHFSFIGNICAHSGDRNPDINFPPRSCIEVVNNVFYNATSEFAEVWESYGGTPVSIVGNYFKAGPNTTPESVGIVRQTFGGRGASSIFAQDNVFEGEFVHVTPSAETVLRSDPPCRLTVRALGAAAAYDVALARAGAWPRDAIDARVIADVGSGTGHIVHKPGVIPPVVAAQPYPDSDRDGMDDRWETANGADSGVPDPWGDRRKDGKDNLTRFLEHLDTENGV